MQWVSLEVDSTMGSAASVHQRRPHHSLLRREIFNRGPSLPPLLGDDGGEEAGASTSHEEDGMSSEFSARLARAAQLESSDDDWDSPAMSERFVSGPAAEMRRAVSCNAYDRVTDLIIDNGFPVTYRDLSTSPRPLPFWKGNPRP